MMVVTLFVGFFDLIVCLFGSLVNALVHVSRFDCYVAVETSVGPTQMRDVLASFH